MAKVEDEFNHIPEIKDAIEYLASHRVEIGIFGSDDSKMLMIARVQEYGVEIEVTDAMRGYLWSQGMNIGPNTEEIVIPERSFIRAGFDEGKEEFFKAARHLIQQALMLEIPPETALDMIGEDIRNSLQEYLINVSSPPNHPFTAERKGSSNPLMDEGNLKDAITYRIESG